MIYVSIFSVLIPLLLGVIFWKHLDRASIILTVMLVSATFSQIGPTFFPKAKFYIYNGYTIIDLLLMATLFLSEVRTKTIRLSIIFFTMFELVVGSILFSSEGIGARFYNELVCLNSIVLTVFVLIFFVSRFYHVESSSIEFRPVFWFSLGVLIYSPCTYFLFVFYDLVKRHPVEGYSEMWTIHSVLNSLMYLIFCVGICVNRFQRKIKPQTR